MSPDGVDIYQAAADLSPCGCRSVARWATVSCGFWRTVLRGRAQFANGAEDLLPAAAKCPIHLHKREQLAELRLRQSKLS